MQIVVSILLNGPHFLCFSPDLVAALAELFRPLETVVVSGEYGELRFSRGPLAVDRHDFSRENGDVSCFLCSDSCMRTDVHEFMRDIGEVLLQNGAHIERKDN